MVTADEARSLALSLPESLEQDHHGFPSFRVRGKIFATLPDDEHLNIMVDEGRVRVSVGEDPDACEELWWGRRLSGVRVTLHAAAAEMVEDLLGDAWSRKAPQQLLRKTRATE